MTTIACDGRMIAGDGQADDNYDTIVSTNRRKVHWIDTPTDGPSVVAWAGSAHDGEAWVQWLMGGSEAECPIQSDKFGALRLSVAGLFWVDHKGRELLIGAPAAIGSGQDYALGAMEAGKSALDAVVIACKRDPYSSGECYGIDLHGREWRPGLSLPRT